MIVCLLMIALVFHGVIRESSIAVMPPKKTSEKITEELRELRRYVQEHDARLNMRSGTSLQKKLEQRFSLAEKAWSNYLAKHSASFTETQREEVSGIFALVDGGAATALIGGVQVCGPLFCWRIRGRESQAGPWRLTREEAEADGQLCNAVGLHGLRCEPISDRRPCSEQGPLYLYPGLRNLGNMYFPRRTRITKGDLATHGYTEGCLSLIHI